MKKIYGDEFVKALMPMISSRNFNRDIEKSYGWWDIKLKSSDLDAFLRYVDFDKIIKINSIELEMLTGTLDSIKFIEYYAKEETVPNYELTALDLLLYASLKNEVVFEKLLKIEDINYSNITYTLYKLTALHKLKLWQVPKPILCMVRSTNELYYIQLTT